VATPVEPTPEQQISRTTVPLADYLNRLTVNPRRSSSLSFPEIPAEEVSREPSSRASSVQSGTPSRRGSGRPETSSRLARLLHSVGNAAHSAGDKVENFDRKATWGALERGLSNRAGRLATWARGFAAKRAQKGATRLNRIGDRTRILTATGLRTAGSLFLRASAALQSAGNKAHQQADRLNESPATSTSGAPQVDLPQPQGWGVPPLSTDEFHSEWERIAVEASHGAAHEPRTQIKGDTQAAHASRPVSRASSASSSRLDFSAAAASPVSGAPGQESRTRVTQNPTYSRPSTSTQQSPPKGGPSR
jgi:hypothetical protein